MTQETNSPKDARVPRLGYFYVVLAALMWAVSGSSAKFLFHSGVTPLQLVQTRSTLAGVLLLVWLAALRPRLLRIAPRDLRYFAVLGTTGLAAVHFTYLYTISKIQVAAAILLEYLAPVFITVYAVIFLRDRLKPLTAAAVLGATAGCYLVVGGYNLDLLAMNRLGLISGLISAISFAWYSVYGEKGMCRYKPWTVLLYSTLFAALFWNLAHIVWEPAPRPLELLLNAGAYPPVTWFWIFYIGIFGTMIPFGLYLQGINLIRATRASVTATLEPILAGVVSYFFLGESFEALQILGGVLVIGAIIVLQLRRETDEKTPELIRCRREASEPASTGG